MDPVKKVTAVEKCPAVKAEGEILPILRRYIDQYQWRWNLARRVINLYFGTAYTEQELKRLYKQGK